MGKRDDQPEEPKSYQDQVLEALAAGKEIPDFPEANSMEQMAILHNELYRAYQANGFEDAEALYMTAVLVTQQPGPPPK